MVALLIFINAICSGFSNDIYEHSILSIESSTISFSSFKGKRILIAEFSAALIDTAYLQYLNTLQKADSSLIVIAIPSTGIGTTVNKSNLTRVKATLDLSYIIAIPAIVKKNGGLQQHKLFKWLTDVKENSHFDQDVGPQSELFFINKQGLLYGVLSKDTPKSIISKVLKG